MHVAHMFPSLLLSLWLFVTLVFRGLINISSAGAERLDIQIEMHFAFSPDKCEFHTNV